MCFVNGTQAIHSQQNSWKMMTGRGQKWKTSFDNDFSAIKKQILEACSVNELRNVDKLNLNNCYRNRKRGKLRCLLCKITIDENDAFEHSRSAAHKNNKIFCNLLKNRNRDRGTHFVVLGTNWVECRYCVNAQFRVPDYELCYQHNRSTPHLERVRYCQNTITEKLTKKQSKALKLIEAAELREYKRRERLCDQYFDINYGYNDVPRVKKKDEKMIPTWVWVGMCCIIAWRYFRSQ